MEGRVEHNFAVTNKTKTLLKSFDSIYEEYYNSLTAAKEPKTILYYIRLVTNFMEYASDERGVSDPAKIKKADVDAYMNHLRYIKSGDTVKQTSDSYRATVWSALNSFYGFMEKSEYIETNFMSKVERPKVKDDVQRIFMTPKELRAIVRNAESVESGQEWKKDYKGWETRNVVIIRMLIETGMRVTALTEINLQDINYESNVVRVIDKRRKVHEYPISNDTAEYIKKWLEYRNKLLTEDKQTDAVFISNHKKRITDRSIETIVKKLSSGIDKKISPHKFRGSYATNLYHATGDIYLVKECMGHESVNTTQIYVQPDSESREKALGIMEKILKNN